MLNKLLSEFYERDLRKLIEEVNLFKNEADFWKTAGTIKNSAGNLVLHIIGGTNHHIGATLANTGYIRDRDREFAEKDVPRPELVARLEELIIMVTKTITSLTPEQMEADFPKFFDKHGTSNAYVLTQLLVHLNYHLGQVNYLRRVLE